MTGQPVSQLGGGFGVCIGVVDAAPLAGEPVPFGKCFKTQQVLRVQVVMADVGVEGQQDAGKIV